MRPFLLSILFFLATSATQAFASDVKIPRTTIAAFNSAFGNVSNIEWAVVDNMYRAAFTIEGEQKVAFFTMADGKLVATCHYLTVSALPKALKRNLSKHTANAVVTDLFEIQDEIGSTYYLTVMKENKKVILKSDTDKWNVHIK
jgi:hypothetical protein